ncbi:glucosaminidase domain-containing protein [Mariniluteicoccus flavus]
MRRIPHLLALVLALVLGVTGLGIARAPEASAAVDTGRFIRAVAPAAQRAQQAYRVPASVSIAQSILESGWGQSSLSLYGHAYFGIKCKTDYTSPFQLGCVDKSSLEYFDPANPVPIVSAFRTYRSAEDSFADHGYFLKNSTRYAAAFTTTNPNDFIREVGKAGYATDPGYADYIIGLMTKYGLYAYDTAPINTTPVAVDGAIGAKFAAVGGVSSALSWPIGGAQDGPVTGATMVPFNRGMIVSTPAHGAHPLTGEVWNHYRFSQNVREHLQFPTTDAYAVGAATVQKFTGGAIVRTGGASLTVWGEIGKTWTRLGAERGKLGLPTSGEMCGLVGGGCFQRFTFGAVYWSPQTGAHPVWGAIGERWADFSWEFGRLGYPTSDEMCGLVRGGCWQTFERGRLYFSPDTGAQPLWGAIGDRWNEMGFESGPLGYPMTAESCGLRDGGCFQHFQGGSIHWSGPSGAWPTWGAIRGHWASYGWEAGRYGYAVGKESCGTPGGVFTCTQGFQGGTITYRAGQGTF